MITAQELRQKYLDFFKSKGHTIIPSASLIPENDSTVLFTTAGMHPLVPYFLGEDHPGGKRLTSCQKCIRTGDIDEVGDNVHLTFFEMLGNWSLGDPVAPDGIGQGGYWKKEAIEWSFEFLTKELGLSKDKIAISCFEGEKNNNIEKDDESAKLWQAHGVLKERIVFLGREDNWWGPAGQTGPCGPDTEMFYWAGKGATPNVFDPTDKRWVEIWNDVFMQYNKTADGKYEPLKQKIVDTGMGLERTLAVLNGCDNVFTIEEFAPIISKIKELATKPDERVIRIIADHIKAAVFIMGDTRGIKPSNLGQGYVVRRLIREAIESGKSIGVKTGLVVPVAEIIISIFKNVYSELQRKREFIIDELMVEEDKYSKTLIQGLPEIRRLYDFYRTLGKVKLVNGKDFFDLYQSHGLRLQIIFDEWDRLCQMFKTPNLSLTNRKKEIASEYSSELKEHQESSRTASAEKFKGGLADNSEIAVKYHTATHLLHKALREVLGEHVAQKGSNITAERLRFDFSHPTKMTAEEISKVEKIVNEKIKQDLPVHFEMLSVDEAKQKGALGLFDDKYAKLGNKVKVYFIGDPSTSSGRVYSAEICGGPHVEHTGQIGSLKIIKEEAVSAGIRRIKAIAKSS
ncbi:MAG: alanine--tRNA ligase [Patescibacteria group bacterium]